LRETGSVTILSAAELQPYFAGLFPKTTPPWIRNLREDAERCDHLIHVYRWSPAPEVSFHLVNPKFAEAWPGDRLTLSLLERPARRMWPSVPVAQITRQFVRYVERRVDLEHEMRDLTQLELSPAQSSPTHPQFALPRIAEKFCCPGIVAIREPPLTGDAHPFPKVERQDAGEATSAELDVTRLLCLTWLHQALKVAWFPQSPTPSSVGITMTGQIAWLGGSIASLDRELQDALSRYLGAVASNRPDEAATALLQVFHPRKTAADLEMIRDRFRQVVPFRDGGWGRTGQLESFAEYVFIQWRIATESGYEAPEEIIPFVRSFWELALISRAVAPGRDVLREALDEFRWIDAFDKLRGMLTAGNLARQGQEWLDLMMEIPDKLDAIATSRLPHPAASKTSGQRRVPPNPWPAAAVHVLVLALMALLLVKLAETRVVGEWVYAVGLVAFVGVALSLLTLFKKIP
jgi:hypothetical protein